MGRVEMASFICRRTAVGGSVGSIAGVGEFDEGGQLIRVFFPVMDEAGELGEGAGLEVVLDALDFCLDGFGIESHQIQKPGEGLMPGFDMICHLAA